MKFTCPAIVTISGHIVIEAKDLNEARAKAKQINSIDGVSADDLNDTTTDSELMLDEIAKVGK